MVGEWHPQWQKGDRVAFGLQQDGTVREASEGYRIPGIQVASKGQNVAKWLLGGNKVALSDRHVSGIQVASQVARR